MEHERGQSSVCVLPSGRVAVVGGIGADGVSRKDCEAFDPVKRTWEPLPEMDAARAEPAAAPVAVSPPPYMGIFTGVRLLTRDAA